MTLVRHKDKKSGRIYVYDSTPHYDPKTKQQRPKRKYLGVEDPNTGELIPSAGKRGRRSGVKNMKKSPEQPAENKVSEQQSEQPARLEALESELKSCKEELVMLRKQLERYRTILSNISRLANVDEQEEL